MADIMAQLGAFQFSINTAAFSDAQRSTSYKWAAIEQIGELDALQFVGPGSDTVSISGVIFPHFRGGLGQIDGMRTEAAKGKPLQLVDGRGRILGKWVIEQIDEGQTVFTIGGAPLRQSFNLRIRRFSDG